jgi:PleD family two-component response regulator
MYLVCPACSKRLQIPDDKLPTDQAVRLACPACQERFSYDPHAHRAAGETTAETRPAPPMGAPAGMPRQIMTEPNVMQALVCLDDAAHQDACRQTLQALGYAPDVMPNQSQALEYLRQVPYRLFVLDAAFDGTSLETNLVLTFLRERPLDQRRYQFVVLCAPDLVTADAMTAYGQGVNLVINHADLPDSGPVLAQHLAEHELLYRTFRAMRQQLGKEV